MIYFFSAIYEAQNADNARTLGIQFDNKLREVHAIVRRCNYNVYYSIPN